MSYAKAGVNRSNVQNVHKLLARRLESTFQTRRGKVGHPIFPIGHYAGLVDLGQGRVLSLHTDSVGTKVLVAQSMGKYDTIGIDCVAMCANDLICTGAEPISFLDYMAMAKPDHAIVEKVAIGLVKGAKEAGMAIIGGETAVVPELLAEKSGFDLVGLAAGYCKKSDLVLGDKIQRDDVLIGVSSSGIHSNGLTLARKVLLKKHRLRDKLGHHDRILGEQLLEPTRIYVKPVKDLRKTVTVHGMAHITGGGFSKLERIVGQAGFGAYLDGMPAAPEIFQQIQKTGHVSEREMYQTFNMGIGFVVVCPEDEARKAISIFMKHGQHAERIGLVSVQQGIRLDRVGLL